MRPDPTRDPGVLTGLFLDPRDGANAAVLPVAVAFIGFAALFAVADGVQSVALGMLRGLQDTRVPMWVAIGGYRGLGVPLGAGLAWGAGYEGYGIWNRVLRRAVRGGDPARPALAPAHRRGDAGLRTCSPGCRLGHQPAGLGRSQRCRTARIVPQRPGEGGIAVRLRDGASAGGGDGLRGVLGDDRRPANSRFSTSVSLMTSGLPNAIASVAALSWMPSKRVMARIAVARGSRAS